MKEYIATSPTRLYTVLNLAGAGDLIIIDTPAHEPVSLKGYRGQATFEIRGNTCIDVLDGDLVVNRVSGGASIGSVRDRVTIDTVRDEAHIAEVRDEAHIAEVRDEAHIGNVFNHATIAEAAHGVLISYVGNHAIIGKIGGRVSIFNVCNHATIGSVCGEASIDIVEDNVAIGAMYNRATIRSVNNRATIGSVYGCASIVDLCGKAIVDYVGDRASIGSVRDRVTINNVCDCATIAIVRDRVTIGKVLGRCVVSIGAGTIKSAPSPFAVIFKVGKRAVIPPDAANVIDYAAYDMTHPALWATVVGASVEGKEVILYKAVDDHCFAGHSHILTTYPVGETVTCADWRDDNNCGGGLHASPSPYEALSYARDATRMLKVSAPIDSIRPILDGVPKAKAPMFRVLEEVALDGSPLDATGGAAR